MPETSTNISILRNGTEISDSLIHSATLNFGFSTLPKANLLLGAPSNTEFFQECEKEQWQLGESIDIKLGCGEKSDLIFSGIIVNHKVSCSDDENYLLEIELGHKYYLTSIKKNSRIFTQKKASDAIQEILNEYGFTPEMDSTHEIQRQFVQFNTSDWDFINSRAELANRYVIPKNETFVLKNITGSETEKLSLTFGSDILKFNLETGNRFSFENFETKTWDFQNQEIISIESSENFPSTAGNLTAAEIATKSNHGSVDILALGSLSEMAANEISDRKNLNAELSKIRGSIQTMGNNKIEIGDWLKVNGVGKQFSGQLLVTAITHEISDRKWKTTYQIGTNSQKYGEQNINSTEYFVEEKKTGINGLQIGVVSKLESEENDDKILVQLPHLKTADGAVWARCARMEAGNNRGWIFRPEIGDEVIVGFINDDPQQALILGAMNSQVHIAPIEANDQNNLKGYVSRSQLKLLFDEEKKNISILTPNVSIELNEDTKKITIKNESNSFELSPDGIKIETEKDFKIKAKGNIEMEGMNMKLKSNVELKAEAGASFQIRSSGTTNIQGAIVTIN